MVSKTDGRGGIASDHIFFLISAEMPTAIHKSYSFVHVIHTRPCKPCGGAKKQSHTLGDTRSRSRVVILMRIVSFHAVT